ncbi:DUF6795 domain-containing protein [Shewanella japonica]|uniref:DUF6795 domain-containing protein n=1 Tax=Shewanella japonica TaxID=93973 RepID=A0ABM6JN21_9GAMM|nr:DUF6795 domain-containing protein [Shewanella japonica]ARD23734.1 hypothetical protein SJ2017_3485 [Shewanella japonica]
MKKFTVFAALVSCLLMLVVSSHSEGTVLGIFKKAVDVEVFPAVSGKITLNGKPVEGLKLRRGYLYINVMEDGVYDYTTTGSNGEFSFPEIVIQSTHPNGLFSTNIISQIIRVEDDRYEEYQDPYIWATKSRGIKHSPYFQERLASLNCELTEEEMVHHVINDSYEQGVVRYEIDSICRWPELEKIEVEKRKIHGKY